MATIGQIVGGVAGGILGTVVGVGPIIGFTIGLGIGTFIDPPKIEEPDASPFAHQDLQFNTFQRNLPVPIVYGVNRVGGNILWIGNTRTEIREHDAEGGGGKGLPSAPDPPTVQEQIFHADFSMAISEGEIAGVARTWVDDDDISAREGLDFTVYTGTSSQAIPSEMVTALGSDALPFRHTAHTLFSGELGNINRIPVVNQLVSGVKGGIGAAGNTVLGPIAGIIRFHCTECFDDRPDTCLACTMEDARIYRSIDGGKNWEFQGVEFGNIGTNHSHRIEVHKGIAGRAYYAIGGGLNPGNRIVRTEDYGVTWANTTDVGSMGGITSFIGFENNSSEVLAFGNDPANVYKSSDGGLTWTLVFSTLAFGTTDLQWGGQFPGTDVVVIIAGNGGSHIWRSPSRGDAGTWSSITHSADSNSGAGDFLGMADGVGFGHTNNQIIKTADTGLTWADQAQQVGGIRIRELGGTLYSQARVTNDCELLTSTDLGSSWTCVHSELPSSPERDFFVTEHNLCYVGGTPAAIYCERFTIPTSCGNPANIVHDFLTNERYALGISSSRIDEESFAGASAYCAGPVTLPDGTVEQRFCLDIVLDRGKPAPDHLRDMLSTFRGFLAYSQGTVKLKIEKEEPVSQSFDMGNIVPESFKWRKQSYRDRPNVVRVQYVEPGDDDEYRLDFQSAFDDWDIDQSGERRERIFRLVGIKRRNQARRMATFYLDQAIHITNAAAFRVGIGGLQSEVGDVIDVSHDVPAWTKKKCRIMEIEEAEDDELSLTVLEYNAAIYGDELIETEGDRVVPFNSFAVPYHPGRLTAYQRPSDNNIELALTRVATNDLTSTERFFLKRGAAEFEAIGQGLPFGPTAFIDSDLRSTTRVTTGVGSGDPGGGGGGVNSYDGIVIADSPWGYWKLDETAGPRAWDTMSTHPMSYTPDRITYQTSLQADVMSHAVHIGSGGPGFIQIPNALVGSFSNEDFSIEVWTKSNCWELNDGANLPGWCSMGWTWGGFLNNLRPMFMIRNADTNFYVASATTQLSNDNQMYHLVGVRTQTFQAIYVNATLEGSRSSPAGNLSVTAPTFRLGSRAEGNDQIANADFDEVAYYPFALTSAQIAEHYFAVVSPAAVGGDPAATSGWIQLRGIPDQWSARLFNPSCASIAEAIASAGDGTLTIPTSNIAQPISGFIDIYTDATFSFTAEGGRFPTAGDQDFQSGDEFDYVRATQFITDTQTFIPVFAAKGGFANVGSLRLRAEEMGYDTFTDSRLEGVTRGAGGTAALSHTNVRSLEASVMESGGGLMDLSIPFTDPLSNVEFFTENSVYLYLGTSSKFPRVIVDLARNAAGVVSLSYEYSTGDGTWASGTASGFVPVLDTTSGLTRSGEWLLEPWGDWSPTNRVTSGGTTLADATSRYYLRILRASSLGAFPKELQFGVDGDLVGAVRKANAFVYPRLDTDSGQTLTFKAIATGPRGDQADGTKAPLFTIVEGA